MSGKSIFYEYQQFVEENSRLLQDTLPGLMEEVAASPAKYKGEPVEFLYQPLPLTSEDINRFAELTGTLMGILEKVMDRYLEDPAFRKHFLFSPLLEQLILKDPGYQRKVPMARFDIFYHYSDQFQFCELNTDGSSGMVEQRELQRILSQAPGLKGLRDQYELEGFELFDSWVEALLENYREYSGSDQKPRIAIVDFMKAEPPSEFVEFQKAFEKAGCPAVIVDPRKLTYENGRLKAGALEIDCIYRRAVTWEIIEHAEEVQPFIQAYLDGAVCVVGSLRSQIIHNKQVFAILHDPEATHFLTEADRAFIKAHIPMTRIFDNQNEALVQLAMKEQQQLVLKPMDRYASNGVRVGQDYSPEEWRRLIEEEARSEYLLQEFCQVPKMPMVRIDEKGVQLIPHHYIIGLFLYNGDLQGVYTRTGTKNIIGSVVECFTAPNLVFRKKSE